MFACDAGGASTAGRVSIFFQVAGFLTIFDQDWVVSLLQQAPGAGKGVHLEGVFPPVVVYWKQSVAVSMTALKPKGDSWSS